MNANTARSSARWSVLLDSVQAGRGLVKHCSAFTGVVARQTSPNGVEQSGIVRPELLNRKIAAEHAASRTEGIDGSLNEWTPFVDVAAVRKRSEAGYLRQDVWSFRELGKPLPPFDFGIAGRSFGHSSVYEHEIHIGMSVDQREPIR